ncbi:MAG: isochorismatase family protein [Holophaga sp.]|nr:isochorismatase family protein [Holophaga sp.]
MNEFKLDPKRTAILVNDLQNINLRLPGAPLPRTTMTENILRLLVAGRRAGVQPVLVHAGGAPDGADRLKPLTDAPAPAAVPLPADWSELLPELDRQPGDIVILKRQWGAFYGTDLDLQLRRRKLGTVVLCGIATELGVESTARQAHELGYDLVFASDCMTGMVAESHADAIDRLFPRMGRVRSADQIIAAFDA